MDEATPEQWLASYRTYLQAVELTLGPCRSIIPPDDPLAQLVGLCFERSEALRQAIDRGAVAECGSLFLELKELKDQIPEIATTRPPFLKRNIDSVTASLRAAGHSDESVSAILEEADNPGMGPPRKERWTAIRALRMHNDKSYPEIADALCPNKQHVHRRMDAADNFRLDACSDHYRNEIRRLKAVLKKYSPADSAD